MSQTFLPPKWLQQLCDPYAVLGISVIAGDRQILKRYHTLAKLLHPDRHTKSSKPDQELATAIFSHLINPAYEQLKHQEKRLMAIAMLRSFALEQKPLSSQSAIAEKILEMSTPQAELFYEEAIACYAEDQYKSLDQFYQVTQQINTLNLVYLRLHKPDLQSTQKAVSILSKVEVKPVELTLNQKTDVKPVVTYAQRHYQRAIEYVKLGKWPLAVSELRDAIKLEPNNSDYYALLGLVHLKQKFIGMARVYIHQALKLNPQNSLALKYAPEVKIQSGKNTNPKSMATAMSIAALLSRFAQKKGSQVKW
ncbi:heat shock protein DnaJ domain-containing protein [Nostoc commune NIES-4072]|uniref:Heat shock protein DnaJ domain-containing protein n=1 Tax=Nostoc commune NIES-4072 TaxID=2005467 RepID=A0A2R5FR50_NOSCO|nr:DnaJ domain-containing protein [Nostoc commune]BBD67791.1 heat shock protein DnaJ domain-containing protein [Nostoc commune HK-02]GBG21227.1 heat shock protein DnaJ domain-containing protein [Nostoc commune NIES-4072]